MVRPHPGRRRPLYGPHLCAAAAAVSALVLLLLSLSTLHSRLSSNPTPHLLKSESTTAAVAAEEEEIRIDHEPLDEISDEDDDSNDEIISAGNDAGSGYFWDHAAGAARQSFGGKISSEWTKEKESKEGMFGSDDQPVDEAVRLMLGSSEDRSVEELLLMRGRRRRGWAPWLEGKADFLRRDRMLRSNLEILNPKSHPLLQDPDMPSSASAALTRADRLIAKTLATAAMTSPPKLPSPSRKIQMIRTSSSEDFRRWGYFPGIEPRLSFSEFMDRFLSDGLCPVTVFMVWNTPTWTYGVRQRRGLESLLFHHPDACVVVFSETMDLDFFEDFVSKGYRVAVVMPNLDELLKDTPAHMFASVWFEWRKTTYYSIHYSELIRLAALYKYGGVYLDTDIIVLKKLQSLYNSLGSEEQTDGSSIFNGAVMAFKRHSAFLMECMREFYSTYDDTRLRWNGAELMTRVMKRLYYAGEENSNNKSRSWYGAGGQELGIINTEPPAAFFPISQSNIIRYYSAAEENDEREEQEVLVARILKESTTFHLWNGLTAALVPQPNSLVERVVNTYCLHCLDVL